MAGSLRKLFTNEEVAEAITNTENYVEAGRKLTELGRGVVSGPLVLYWDRHLSEVLKKNGEPYIGTTVLDRKIRNEEIKLRKRGMSDDDKQYDLVSDEDNRRVLIMNDTHAPYVHKDALSFLMELDRRLKFTRVIHGGDETDSHALSFHDSDPNLDSAGAELYKARLFMQDLAKLFPVMDLCHSNHGSLVYRRAHKAGMPVEMIKSYRDILFPDGGGDGWSWHESVRFTLPNGEDCIVKHEAPGSLLSNAAHERANFIQAHRHSQWILEGKASDAALYWGMLPGCLIDRKSRAFDYGKLNLKRPAIGVGVIINSLPILIPMPLDSKGRWNGTIGGFVNGM